jgi:signal transduction histidine kinase
VAMIGRLRRTVGSIRGRMTAAAVILVGIALLVGAIALVSVMREALTASVRDDARLRAEETAGRLATGIPITDAVRSGSDDILIQVLDIEGRVIAASAEAPSAAALASSLAPGAWVVIDLEGDDDPFLVAAEAAETADGGRAVLVARSLDMVVESTELVAGLLVIGLPLLLILVGALAWLLVGRALAPVEAIRREVEEITGSELYRRVPVGETADEIGRLATTMNGMLARLERASARQRQLVSDTSHELRSPIASIRQHAEVALAHPDGTTSTELADTVLAEGLRLGGLVDDLLLLARADERMLDAERRPVDLDDLVLAAARALRATRPDVAIDASAVSGGRVSGDPEGLRRVVDNLADNAARHARGAIACSLVEDGGSVVLRVDDDGPGVPHADRDRIFERFVRLDAARARDAGGTGLGLAIVAEVVAAHGGTVTVAEAPLGGARFEVRLPADRAA